ncbi:MAG: hypothetical protein GC171_06725 [Terrimonas sp.]|nr:hypothetical protein [Terrimonas sp.]
MNNDFIYHVEGNFNPDSRVWVYQSNRLFTLSESLEIEDILNDFTGQWKSHGIPVKGAGYLFFGQFLVLLADESATGVSGCSTDSSVRMVKDIETRFGVNLFERTNLAFIIGNKVQLLPMNQLEYAIQHHFIDGNTLYFNNLVQTKQELEQNWIIPVKNSWLAKKLLINN